MILNYFISVGIEGLSEVLDKSWCSPRRGGEQYKATDDRRHRV